MEIEYTDSEVVANFPEVMQHVRAGKTIVVLCDGEPWAEIRLAKGKKVPGESRYDELVRLGVIQPPEITEGPPILSVERVEGGLDRFLEERGSWKVPM